VRRPPDRQEIGGRHQGEQLSGGRADRGEPQLHPHVGGDAVGHDQRARAGGVDAGHATEIEADAGDVTAVEQGGKQAPQARGVLHDQLSAHRHVHHSGATGHLNIQHLSRLPCRGRPGVPDLSAVIRPRSGIPRIDGSPRYCLRVRPC
jgi:hypothetical protein